MTKHGIEVSGFSELPVDPTRFFLPEGTHIEIKVKPPITVNDKFVEAVIGRDTRMPILISEFPMPETTEFPIDLTVLHVETYHSRDIKARRAMLGKLVERIGHAADHPEAADDMKQQFPFTSKGF